MRSLLFVPADSDRKMQKGLASGAIACSSISKLGGRRQ